MIPGWAIFVLVLVAMLVGIAGNRWMHRGHLLNDGGFGIKELVGPVTTLGVVLMAFVMAQSLGSYGRARENVGTEARVVNEMSESALRLEDREAAVDIQEALLCYARAVRHKEWGPMDLGERDPDTSVWADRLQTDLADLKFATDDDEVGRLIDLDSERASARVARITESSPTNPDGLNWLMLGTVTVSVVGLGLFVNIKGDRFLHVAILAVLTVILAGTLYMINDLDQPFSGLNKLETTDMEHSEDLLAKELPPDDSLRLCDRDGTPV